MAVTSHPLDILFLTNFSEYCFRIIPALAQMVDTLPVRLTLMHAYDPARTSAARANESLRSFFPEADRYRSCRRIAVPGPLLEAVQRHLHTWPVNLVVAPASDSIGLPRIGDRSLRAQLLEEYGIPLWTLGRGVPLPKLQAPIRNVACHLDFRSERHPQLPYAIEFARSLGATLHLLRGLPSVDEGLLMPPGPPDQPLHPDRVAEELSRLCAGSSVEPEVHVARDEGRASVVRLLKACDADVVFMHNEEGLLSRWLKVGLRLRLGDVAPCPVVYVDERTQTPVWNLEPVRRPQVHIAARELVAVRARAAMSEARLAATLPGLAEIGLA